MPILRTGLARVMREKGKKTFNGGLAPLNKSRYQGENDDYTYPAPGSAPAPAAAPGRFGGVRTTYAKIWGRIGGVWRPTMPASCPLHAICVLAPIAVKRRRPAPAVSHACTGETPGARAARRVLDRTVGTRGGPHTRYVGPCLLRAGAGSGAGGMCGVWMRPARSRPDCRRAAVPPYRLHACFMPAPTSAPAVAPGVGGLHVCGCRLVRTAASRRIMPPDHTRLPWRGARLGGRGSPPRARQHMQGRQSRRHAGAPQPGGVEAEINVIDR